MRRRVSLFTGRLSVWAVALVAACLLAGCNGVEYNRIDEAVRFSETVERRLEKINQKYRLGAMDQIQVNVAGAPNVSGGHTIRPDGNITIEDIQDVYVEGMTPMQAADVVGKELAQLYREVSVTVRVTGFNSKKFYMFGEVNTVGEFAFDGDVTILAAFGRARGITTRAAWDRIRLVRATTNTRQVYKINLADIVTQGDWETNLQMKANDVVYIPPTYLARVGYLIDNVLFPFRSLFGAFATFRTGAV